MKISNSVIEVFQFQKVRLKVETAMKHCKYCKFQFQKVRLKDYSLHGMRMANYDFNSKRFD